jgi:hypothetical protein
MICGFPYLETAFQRPNGIKKRTDKINRRRKIQKNLTGNENCLTRNGKNIMRDENYLTRNGNYSMRDKNYLARDGKNLMRDESYFTRDFFEIEGCRGKLPDNHLLIFKYMNTSVGFLINPVNRYFKLSRTLSCEGEA